METETFEALKRLMKAIRRDANFFYMRGRLKDLEKIDEWIATETESDPINPNYSAGLADMKISKKTVLK